jgi:hypothetical protein
MSLRRKNNVEPTAGDHGAATNNNNTSTTTSSHNSQQVPRSSPSSSFETGTGFAVTSNGAIGFSQEIEKKLEVINNNNNNTLATHMKIRAGEEENQRGKAPGPSTNTTTISCNRDAYAHIHITCASLNGGGSSNAYAEETTAAGAAASDPADNAAEETTTAFTAAYPFSSHEPGVHGGGYEQETGLNLSVHVPSDPQNVARDTIRILNKDRYFADASRVQTIARDALIPHMAADAYRYYLNSEEGSRNLKKDLEVLKAMIKTGTSKYFGTEEDRTEYTDVMKAVETQLDLLAFPTAITTEGKVPIASEHNIFDMLFKYKASEATWEEKTRNQDDQKTLKVLLADLEETCAKLLQDWASFGNDLITFQTYKEWKHRRDDSKVRERTALHCTCCYSSSLLACWLM